jgi:N-acetylglucosaminyldiphosphoundecaprenol N-acetyl-beta-D-mannosaminyltransferase
VASAPGGILIQHTHAHALPDVVIGGLKLHAVTQADAIAHMVTSQANGRGGLVVNPNVDHLRLLRTNGDLRRAYDDADLVLADGMPLIWASAL